MIMHKYGFPAVALNNKRDHVWLSKRTIKVSGRFISSSEPDAIF